MNTGRDPKKNIVRIRYGDQERFIALDGDEFLIGRDEGAAIRVPITAVSRRHALVKVAQGRITVRDLGSSNGTFVGGKKIKRGEEIDLTLPGEEFALGNSVFITVQPRVEFTESAVSEMTPAVVRAQTGAFPSASNNINPVAEPGNPTELPDMPEELAIYAEAPFQSESSLQMFADSPVPVAPNLLDEAPTSSRVESVAELEPAAAIEPPDLTQEMRRELTRSVVIQPVPVDFIRDPEPAPVAAPVAPAPTPVSAPTVEAKPVPPMPAGPVKEITRTRERIMANAVGNTGPYARVEIEKPDYASGRAEAARATQPRDEQSRAELMLSDPSRSAPVAERKFKTTESRIELERPEMPAPARVLESARVDTGKIELAVSMSTPALEAAIQQLKAQAETLNSEVWDLKAQRVHCERELASKKKALEEELAEMEDAYAAFERKFAAARDSFERDLERERDGFEKKREVFEFKRQAIEREFAAKREVLEREFEEVKARIDRETREKQSSIEGLFNEKSETLERNFEMRRDAIELELKQKQDHVEVELKQKQENLELMMVGLKARQTETERDYNARKEVMNAEITALREEQANLDTELSAKREFVRRAISDLDKAQEKAEQDHFSRRAKAEREFEAFEQAQSERRVKAEQEFAAREQELSNQISELRIKGTEAREELEALAGQRDIVVRDAQRAKAESEREMEAAGERVRNLGAEATAAQTDLTEKKNSIRQLRSEISELTQSLAQLQEKRDSTRKQADEVHGVLSKLEFELKEQREAARRETETREYEIRKTRAHFDTLEAEFQVKKLNLEAAIGEVMLRQMEARKELQAISNRRDETALEIEKIKNNSVRDVTAASEKLESLQAEARKADEEIVLHRSDLLSLRDQTAQAGAALAALNEQIETIRQERDRIIEEVKASGADLIAFKKRSEQEKAQLKARAEAEYQAARGEMDAEFSRAQKAIEAELTLSRKNLEAELAETRQNAQKVIESEVSRRHSGLEREFKERATQLEREIADAKMSKLREIEKLKDEAEAVDRTRRDYMLEEIVRGAVELSKQRALTEIEGELRSVVRSVLEGKTVGTLSAEASERTRKFWTKVGTYCAIPVAAVLIYVAFPGIPGWFAERVNRTIASERKDGGVFLDEIHQKGMKYQPPMDHEYRETYAENILYLEGYIDMKLDEQEQKKWIVVLNDFIVGRLGLSDRIIPDFIASEDYMVKELLSIRQGMLPQFKEQGLTRLADVERQERAKLVNFLESEENYRKFRDLERSYYVKYAQDHRGKAR